MLPKIALLAFIGLLLLGTANATPNNILFTAFVTFWMPAIVLAALGIITLLARRAKAGG